jgi:1-acyl-sn-glycerol-3-phosphate acyltransferase
VRTFAPLRAYGRDRIPANGPLVFCFNHFSVARPWAFGSVVPRTVYYVAKQEAHDNPIIGPFIRFFGTSSVRRGESDREAIRIMREVVRRGDALGMFPEGTRQKREPGRLQGGAAHDRRAGTGAGRLWCDPREQDWKFGNFQPVSLAFGEPLDLSGHPRNSQGYARASEEIQASSGGCGTSSC